MEKVHQFFDLIRLKYVAKRRHTGPSPTDLVLDLRILAPLANRAQVGPEIATATILTMAMLAPLLVKQHRPSLLGSLRPGMNRPHRNPRRKNSQRSSNGNETAQRESYRRLNSTAPYPRNIHQSSLHSKATASALALPQRHPMP